MTFHPDFARLQGEDVGGSLHVAHHIEFIRLESHIVSERCHSGIGNARLLRLLHRVGVFGVAQPHAVADHHAADEQACEAILNCGQITVRQVHAGQGHLALAVFLEIHTTDRFRCSADVVLPHPLMRLHREVARALDGLRPALEVQVVSGEGDVLARLQRLHHARGQCQQGITVDQINRQVTLGHLDSDAGASRGQLCAPIGGQGALVFPFLGKLPLV